MATDPTNIGTDPYTDLVNTTIGPYSNIEHTIMDGKDFVLVASYGGFTAIQIDPTTHTFIEPLNYVYVNNTAGSNSNSGAGSDDVQRIDVTDSSGVKHSYFYQYGRDAAGAPKLTVHDYNWNTDSWSTKTENGTALGIDNTNNSLQFQIGQTASGEPYAYAIETISSAPDSSVGTLHKLQLDPNTGLWSPATVTPGGLQADFPASFTGIPATTGGFNLEILTDPNTGQQYLLTARTDGFSIVKLDADGNPVAGSALNYSNWQVAQQITGNAQGMGTSSSLDTAWGNGTITIDSSGQIVIAGGMSGFGVGGMLVIDPTASTWQTSLKQGFTITQLGGLFENPELIYTSTGELIVTSSSSYGAGVNSNVHTTVLNYDSTTGKYTIASQGYDNTFGYDGYATYGAWDQDYTTLSNGDKVYIQANGYASGTNPNYNWVTISNTSIALTPLAAICFMSGTMIETIDGQKRVDDLRAGDLVWTKDNGFKPMAWIGFRRISIAELGNAEGLYPVRIKAGALGENIPSKDLYVTQQHRVLVKSKIAQKMCGFDEVLVAAKQLVGIEGVEIVTDFDEVTYYHFLFDQHEVVCSNGAETESLYTGPEALKAVSPAARIEILSLFPELADMDYNAAPSRIILSGRMSRQLALRHAKNNRPLFVH